MEELKDNVTEDPTPVQFHKFDREVPVDAAIMHIGPTDKEIVKVLSVDFDFIMYPCINLYNDLCSEDENPTVGWDRIEAMINVEDKLTFDKKYYMFIYKLIMQNVAQGAAFFAINNHQDIVDILHNRMMDVGCDVKFDLLNIDHHHDFMYNADKQDLLDFDKYNCGNWYAYLYYKGYLDDSSGEAEVKWLGTPTSKPYNGPDNDKVKRLTIDVDGEEILKDKFDLIVVCFSPQWTPHKYKYLYDIIVETAGMIQGIIAKEAIIP